MSSTLRERHFGKVHTNLKVEEYFNYLHSTISGHLQTSICITHTIQIRLRSFYMTFSKFLIFLSFVHKYFINQITEKKNHTLPPHYLILCSLNFLSTFCARLKYPSTTKQTSLKMIFCKMIQEFLSLLTSARSTQSMPIWAHLSKIPLKTGVEWSMVQPNLSMAQYKRL